MELSEWIQRACEFTRIGPIVERETGAHIGLMRGLLRDAETWMREAAGMDKPDFRPRAGEVINIEGTTASLLRSGMLPTVGETVAQEAQRLVMGDRRKDYGDVRDSFERIAGLWNAHLGVGSEPGKLRSRITAQDVAMMMVLMKVSRNCGKSKRDNLVDIAGYALCAEMLGEGT